MEIEWHSEAEKEFLKLPEQAQKEIRELLKKLREEGLKMEEVGLVDRHNLDLTFYKLKAVKGDKVKHRIAFNPSGEKYLIYKVGPRRDFYREDNLKEVEDRWKS